jgi:hypothetical protein
MMPQSMARLGPRSVNFRPPVDRDEQQHGSTMAAMPSGTIASVRLHCRRRPRTPQAGAIHSTAVTPNAITHSAVPESSGPAVALARHDVVAYDGRGPRRKVA